MVVCDPCHQRGSAAAPARGYSEWYLVPDVLVCTAADAQMQVRYVVATCATAGDATPSTNTQPCTLPLQYLFAVSRWRSDGIQASSQRTLGPFPRGLAAAPWQGVGLCSTCSRQGKRGIAVAGMYVLYMYGVPATYGTVHIYQVPLEGMKCTAPLGAPSLAQQKTTCERASERERKCGMSWSFLPSVEEEACAAVWGQPD